MGGSGVTCIAASTGGTGTFNVNITGLTPKQTYHVQAYATNSVGTSYGGDLSFTAINPAEIGVFRSGNWYLDYTGDGQWSACGTTLSTDRCYAFGLASDIPIAGDWNASGITNIGVFRNGNWYLDKTGDGVWDTGDAAYSFGITGDIPVVGKF